jgi:hypothetical protein
MRHTKLFKFIMMFVLLCVGSAAAASTASAWTTNAASPSGSPFTATASAALLRITPSGGSTVDLNCTGTVAPGNRATGTLKPHTNNATTPILLVSDLQLTFTNCTIAGVPASVACTNSAQLWALSPNPAVPTSVVRGEVRNVYCTVTVPAYFGCTITVVGNGTSGRAVYGDYSNPAATLTALLSPAQTLQATWTTSQCSFLPAGPQPAPARLANKGLTALVYTVTSAFKPVITNP